VKDNVNFATCSMDRIVPPFDLEAALGHSMSMRNVSSVGVFSPICLSESELTFAQNGSWRRGPPRG
jgi:hypothetical protein